MFRGMFLAGTANMSASAWDQRGWAFGNNTLGAYAYTGTALSRGARYSIYYSRDGGRIVSGDLIAGREASRDVGNFTSAGASDVFSVNIGGEFKRAFCMAESPSTSKAFGLYGWCPNVMLHRSTVQLQPTVVARVNNDGVIKTDDDAAALVELWKGKFHWSMRGAIRQYSAPGSSSWSNPASGSFDIQGQDVAIGSRLRYVLRRSTDAETKIKFDTTNCNIKDNKADSKQDMGGVAFWAHAGGFAAGAALVLLFRRPERMRVEWWDEASAR
jgi:hypothetical protein